MRKSKNIVIFSFAIYWKRAVLKSSSPLWQALTSKRFEIQTSDWWENLKIFKITSTNQSLNNCFCRFHQLTNRCGFLVACTRLYNPLCPSVRRLVRQTLLFLLFQRLWAVIALLHLPKCMASLFHHCPCPPTRDLGSRVSGLVFYSLRIYR